MTGRSERSLAALITQLRTFSAKDVETADAPGTSEFMRGFLKGRAAGSASAAEWIAEVVPELAELPEPYVPRRAS